jgi:hypothetical protein
MTDAFIQSIAKACDLLLRIPISSRVLQSICKANRDNAIQNAMADDQHVKETERLTLWFSSRFDIATRGSLDHISSEARKAAHETVRAYVTAYRSFRSLVCNWLPPEDWSREIILDLLCSKEMTAVACAASVCTWQRRFKTSAMLILKLKHACQAAEVRHKACKSSNALWSNDDLMEIVLWNLPSTRDVQAILLTRKWTPDMSASMRRRIPHLHIYHMEDKFPHFVDSRHRNVVQRQRNVMLVMEFGRFIPCDNDGDEARSIPTKDASLTMGGKRRVVHRPIAYLGTNKHTRLVSLDVRRFFEYPPTVEASLVYAHSRNTLVTDKEALLPCKSLTHTQGQFSITNTAVTAKFRLGSGTLSTMHNNAQMCIRLHTTGTSKVHPETPLCLTTYSEPFTVVSSKRVAERRATATCTVSRPNPLQLAPSWSGQDA